MPFREANPVHDLLLLTRKFVDPMSARAVYKNNFCTLNNFKLSK